VDAFVQKNKRYFLIQPWSAAHPHLVAGFTTRDGGQSQSPYTSFNLGFHVGDKEEDVLANRLLLANDIEIPIANWVGSEQVHESNIEKVTMKDAGKGSKSLDSAISKTDGLYTFEQNLLLTSLYADCVPLYFFAPKHGALGLTHAGWRGTVQNIGAKMIRTWYEMEGIPLEDIRVAIGPCISRNSYEVDKKVIKELETCWPKQVSHLPYIEQPNEKYLLDLRKVNKELLLQEGIQSENIIVSSLCTAMDDRLFSHRAEEGKTGRMMSFIGLTVVN
jgi:YfiH family protein